MKLRRRGVPSRLAMSRGFTLVEVLLALVISMGVFAIVATLYYTIAMSWVGHRQGDAKIQHEISIFGFLNESLSVLPSLKEFDNREIVRGVQWLRLPDSGESDPVYLSWWAEKRPAFLIGDEEINHFAVRIYLAFDPGNGISLIWHPEDPDMGRMLTRQTFDLEDYIYQYPLWRDVLSVEHGYYELESDQWEWLRDDGRFDPGENGVPDVVRVEIETEVGDEKFLAIYLSKEVAP